mgnify:CR=1 FL=1
MLMPLGLPGRVSVPCPSSISPSWFSLKNFKRSPYTFLTASMYLSSSGLQFLTSLSLKTKWTKRWLSYTSVVMSYSFLLVLSYITGSSVVGFLMSWVEGSFGP